MSLSPGSLGSYPAIGIPAHQSIRTRRISTWSFIGSGSIKDDWPANSRERDLGLTIVLMDVLIGVLALIAAGLSVIIYEMRGTWPAKYGGWTVAFLFLIGVVLVIHGWQR